MFMNDETNTGELARMIDEIERLSDVDRASEYQKRHACAEAFACLHGWKVSPTAFSIGQLQRGTAPWRQGESPAGGVYDHPEFLRQRGKPRGIVVHVYNLAPLLDAAATDGLHVRVLARSWYYPGATTAVLLTPKE